jgi:hypothetical protein
LEPENFPKRKISIAGESDLEISGGEELGAIMALEHNAEKAIGWLQNTQDKPSPSATMPDCEEFTLLTIFHFIESKLITNNSTKVEID